jgi:hypothetical protein
MTETQKPNKADLKVVPFAPPRQSDLSPVPNVVERCEYLLALAKAGKLRGIGYALVKFADQDERSPGVWTWASGYAKDLQSSTTTIMAASISILQHKFMTEDVLQRYPSVEVPPPEAETEDETRTE